ncbi:Homeobox protein KNOX3 [Hordeum vulgare]|nr:Homeobox protein KNOX3 [Hordeum vulgare]
MRVPGSWRLSADRVPVPPPPSRTDRRAEIARIRSSLPESSRNLPRYAPDSNTLWTAYFEHRQLAATNGVEPRGRHNSEGCRQWWSDRTLEAALEHIEGSNARRCDYPPPPAFSRRRGSSWTLRRVETTSSSSSSSRSRSSGLPAFLPVKPEPHETPLGRRMRSAGIVINEPDASSHLVKPKTELGLLPVKKEHLAMVAADETALKWAKDDYVREEMERQRRAVEEIAARRRGRK